MLTAIFRSIFGTKHERDAKRMRPAVEAINALEPATSGSIVVDVRWELGTSGPQHRAIWIGPENDASPGWQRIELDDDRRRGRDRPRAAPARRALRLRVLLRGLHRPHGHGRRDPHAVRADADDGPRRLERRLRPRALPAGRGLTGSRGARSRSRRARARPPARRTLPSSTCGRRARRRPRHSCNRGAHTAWLPPCPGALVATAGDSPAGASASRSSTSSEGDLALDCRSGSATL